MEIKAISIGSYAIVSTQKSRLPLTHFQEGYALPPLVSDEIIDCTEVQINNYHLVLNREASYQIHQNSLTIGKGTLIDIWI